MAGARRRWTRGAGAARLRDDRPTDRGNPTLVDPNSCRRFGGWPSSPRLRRGCDGAGSPPATSALAAAGPPPAASALAGTGLALLPPPP
eukprot:2563214-Prymnesium_polylepis.2